MSTGMSSSPDHFITPVYTPDIAPVSATLLMCYPKLYDVNYVINHWMEGHVLDS